MRTAVTLVAISVSWIASTALARATPPDVAIVAAAVNTTTPDTNTRFTDVRDKLLGTGLINSCAIFNATAFGPGTPTLAYLQQFDAVIVWSNDSFADAVALGNVLADYVDAGGGVVVSVFANTSTNTARFLQGRWQTGNYIAIPQNGGFTQGAGSLGTVLVPGHSIMNGVQTFSTFFLGASGGYRPTNTSVTAGSTKVALWNTGHTLVALSPNPRVVELGFHPVSSTVNANLYWDASTDGDLIMANALVYVAGGATSPCPGDLNNDRAVNETDLGILLAAWQAGAGGDLDGDSDTDEADLGILLANWGQVCP
ncbi:MAG: hypothetical protein U1D55_06270 [Phycisphaerae bacterium]